MVIIYAIPFNNNAVLITDNSEYGDIEVNEVNEGMILYTNIFKCVVESINTRDSSIKIKNVTSYNFYYGKSGTLKNNDIPGATLTGSESKILYISDDNSLYPITFVSRFPFDHNFPLTFTSPKWHRDDDYKNCEICKKEFGMFTRKHHCRNCGKVVCKDCSPNKYKTERVCNTCFDILRTFKQEKQFISDDFVISDRQIKVGDILTIRNFGRPDIVTYKARVESLEHSQNPPTSYSPEKTDGGIKLTLTEINGDDNVFKVDQNVYLVNLDENDPKLDDSVPSRILIKFTTGDGSDNGVVSTPSGLVVVTSVVTPPAQDGGYKHRKNKSKRKNKRSLRRRRTSKRSNMRRKNKKNTKRLRKSRRRARR
jgi:hypothetical protein